MDWDITTTLSFNSVQMTEEYDVVLLLDTKSNVVLSTTFTQLDATFPQTPIYVILIKDTTQSIRQIGTHRWVLQLSQTDLPTSADFRTTICPLQPDSNPVAQPRQTKPHVSLLNKMDKKHLVVIGSSTGGVQILVDIISNLPDTYSIPTIIVHHLPPQFESTLCNMLQRHTAIPIVVIEDQMPLESKIYLAPYDHHVEVDEHFVAFHSRPFFLLNQRPKEHFMRPAIDPLFKSVATLSQHKITGFILTGMGQDGANGCMTILENGGQIWIQDEQSSAVWGMPKSVQDKIPTVQSLTPSQITEHLSTLSISIPS
jgi:chemotaxis response regulator CheB